jgi:hypothetical protein
MSPGASRGIDEPRHIPLGRQIGAYDPMQLAEERQTRRAMPVEQH